MITTSEKQSLEEKNELVILQQFPNLGGVWC